MLRNYLQTQLTPPQLSENIYFITLTLNKSIPPSLIRALQNSISSSRKSMNCRKAMRKQEEFITKRFLIKYDQLLDQRTNGPHYLQIPEIEHYCRQLLHQYSGIYYELIAFIIMSNHVHLVLHLPFIQDEKKLTSSLNCRIDGMLDEFKIASTHFANSMLRRSGRFWARDNFHLHVSNEKMLHDVLSYTLNHPVRGGLVEHWTHYSGAFLSNKHTLTQKL